MPESHTCQAENPVATAATIVAAAVDTSRHVYAGGRFAVAGWWVEVAAMRCRG
jgi:hypothetical protein